MQYIAEKRLQTYKTFLKKPNKSEKTRLFSAGKGQKSYKWVQITASRKTFLQFRDTKVADFLKFVYICSTKS